MIFSLYLYTHCLYYWTLCLRTLLHVGWTRGTGDVSAWSGEICASKCTSILAQTRAASKEKNRSRGPTDVPQSNWTPRILSSHVPWRQAKVAPHFDSYILAVGFHLVMQHHYHYFGCVYLRLLVVIIIIGWCHLVMMDVNEWSTVVINRMISSINIHLNWKCYSWSASG